MQPEHFLIIGGLSLITCLICFLFYNKNKKLLMEMWAVDTYSAKDLKRLVKGRFEATVEVCGEVICEKPIVSLAADIPCCYYSTSVERQDRRTRTVTAGSGNNRRTRSEADYVWVKDMDEKKTTLFKVRDKTGDTLVDSTRASVETETIVNKIVQHREPWFDLNVRNSVTGKYRIKESVFKPGGFVYVLGEASPTKDGDALIQYPKKGYMDTKKKVFFVSRKSERELTQKKQRIGRVLRTVSVVFFLVVLYSLLAYFHIAPGLNK